MPNTAMELARACYLSCTQLMLIGRIAGCARGCADALFALLHRLAPAALAYLPITFSGSTTFEPQAEAVLNVPADADVADLYHEHLRAQGQHFDIQALQASATACGAACVCVGASDWRLEASCAFRPYVIDFMCGGTAAALWRRGRDARAWRDAAMGRPDPMVVSNVDLLFKLPALSLSRARTYDALVFFAPKRVLVETKNAPPSLAAGTAELRPIVSMVSSGTELLIYRGDFDETDEALDETIGGLADSAIAYPMQYGYSMVGQVVAVGAHAPLRLVGSRVFAFAPHASAAFVDAAGLIEVPADISAADAAFLPAAETAISIVHDAHPRLSDSVAVFGCGVIGLLVVAALARAGATVAAYDPLPQRRRFAAAFGAQTAAHPQHAPRADATRGADCAIECSGNPRALQACIDATRDHGTVVIASWYGRKELSLQLGTRFHRSHLKMVASQVSSIPPAHAATWSKRRRFDAAWALIRAVRPAATMGTHTVALADAARAYGTLDRGEALAYHLGYE